MKISDEKKELFIALNRLQRDLRPASKDAINPHFKNKYSTYESTWEALREPLTENGLFAVQDIETQEKSVSILTTVGHISGQYMEFGPLILPVTKNDAQGFGSAISYGKRYALQAAFGITSGEDDDANYASQRKDKESTEAKSIQHMLGPNQVSELDNMIKDCSKGFDTWLLKQVIKDASLSLTFHNVPLAYYDFCKKSIQLQIKKQLEAKNE